ncbi:MAG TPA: sulfatase-like hydrolase/transferase [Gemmatimonadales bacterium]|nr:sulfatase-like hydrolase/transferase [Gemmatimonadales bacterium]
MRRSAFLWAVGHVPLLLALYGDSAGLALASLPSGYGLALAILFVIEAAFLCSLPWIATLPFSRWPAVYVRLAPLATALAMVLFAVDGRLYRAMQMHLNGLVVRVLLQPTGFHETGITTLELAAVAAAAAAWVAFALWMGPRFITRFASPRRTWPWLLVLLALQLADRVASASLAFLGGPGLFAAAQTMPLQAPLRMNKFLGRLTGRRPSEDIAAVTRAIADAESRVRPARDPGTVRLERRPDIALIILESLPAGFLDSATMPNLWGLAARGARFTRHYASASSTHYALFALLYGLDSRRLEHTIAAGRRPLLFGALRANGYRMRLLAASSVDWMGLRENVFGEVAEALETEFGGTGNARDADLLRSAERFIAESDSSPLFLFAFFDGTHFPYTFPSDSAPFRPYWQGSGALSASRAPSAEVVARARNAAHTVDRRLATLLGMLRGRGRELLVVVVGDHGEEHGQRGRIGHGNDVTTLQTHVPMVIAGPGVPVYASDAVTSHVDIAPTILALLGDTVPASRWSDGVSMFDATPRDFVLTTVGWEPRYAVIGSQLKATFFGLDGGFGRVSLTDPADNPLPDADRRLRESAGAILGALRSGRSRRD